jgi:epoxyqueuosine reductase
LGPLYGKLIFGFMPDNTPQNTYDPKHTALLEETRRLLEDWTRTEGFQQVGVTDVDLGEHEDYLRSWLANDYAGEMQYMHAHGNKRSRPAELVPGTLRVLSFRLDYLKPGVTDPADLISTDQKGYVARYTLGRDYHKVIRQKLKRIWQKMSNHLSEQGYEGANGRVFTDSAPILEKALAEKAGLGWIGKNTLLLSRESGSWFFLGEILTDLPLKIDAPQATKHCGSCSACMDVCPTDAFPEPYQLDARRCISYLTIEHRGSIDESLRKPMGNRIFGCDDCQIFCPWNKFAQFSEERDFAPRNDLDEPELVDLFRWTEETFLKNTEGSAIRRTGYEGWRRNIAIALGNCRYSANIIEVLQAARSGASVMVAEHIDWAIAQQFIKRDSAI